MSIPAISNKIASAVYTIENPNLQAGTLLEEIPADIGRSWEGYKRGGILEGAEKLRKETMAAVVWLFGIPAFNWLGDKFCEHVLKIPTKGIDFSLTGKGNDTIKDSVRYLKGDKTLDIKDLDVSDLNRFKNLKLNGSIDEIVKKIKGAKIATTLSAVVLNCIAMGVIIPKINQALTSKKLKEINNENNTLLKAPSFDEFAKKNNKNISFTGNKFDFSPANIAYLTENNNKFRLIITDIPMIIGRMATSRNKYEALEYLVIDGGSIYFYNFCAENLRDFARNRLDIPKINTKVAQTIASQDDKTIIEAFKKANSQTLTRENTKGKTVLETLFNSKTAAVKMYEEATFGKYGKINKFVSNEQIDEINSDVQKYLKSISKKLGYSPDNKNWSFSRNDFEKTVKSINNKNALFLGIGLIVSILGLAVVMPKLAYKLTTLLTGKNVFTGIEDYSKENASE